MSVTEIQGIDTRVLGCLRRIIRAVDVYSRQLNSRIGLTGPQLTCLRAVVKAEGLTMTMLKREVSLSGSTITGIVDRLETKGMLKRERSGPDRRKIYLRPTTDGIAAAESSPSLLQDKFFSALGTLNKAEQSAIAESLERIVELMESEDIESSLNITPAPQEGA